MFYDIYLELRKFLGKMKEIEFFSNEAAGGFDFFICFEKENRFFVN